MSEIIQSHKQHQNWLLAVNIIKQLNELCFHIRSHRGTSTAQLEGDTFFASISEATASTISEMCVQQDDQCEVFLAFNAYDQFHNVVQQWLEIQLHWKAFQAFENFQKHSLLLETIHQLMWRFSDHYIQQQDSQTEKVVLTKFLLRTHLAAIESVARLRGIGCYLCAKDYLSSEDKKLIREEIRQNYLLWSKRSQALSDLPAALKQPLLMSADNNELNRLMADFTHLLESVIKSHRHIPNGCEVYNAGSSILSAMNLQLNSGLDELKQYLPDTLNSWVNNPAGCESTPVSQGKIGLII